MTEPRIKLTKADLIKISESCYEIPKTYRADMRVPARVFVDTELLEELFGDRSLEQLINVATLPGIIGYALAMPDIHEGYGFPIGGVAATQINHGGVISPGGIGYDINCGVRLLTVNMSQKEIQPFLEKLATELFHAIPSGVGRGSSLKLTDPELDKVLQDGAQYMLERGYGEAHDIELCEERGKLRDAHAEAVSEKAKNRGRDQLGTLGSGNHFLELQVVDEIYDTEVARVFGLEKNHVTIMIHCGSRGLGHQTCTDYVRTMLPKLHEWGITLPDSELACVPFISKEGQEYFAAMCASANFAWANRQVIAHWVRQACKKVLGSAIDVRMVYDLSHNIGKKEVHIVDGQQQELLVHRKGATRAFPAHDHRIVAPYRSVGHPVLIPGTMGTYSYVMVGMSEGMQTAFGSCCHGAGRRMSRIKAKKTIRGSTLRQELEAQGIIVRCDSDVGLAEEAPIAYKDVISVINTVTQAQLARPIARLKPIAVIKGG